MTRPAHSSPLWSLMARTPMLFFLSTGTSSRANLNAYPSFVHTAHPRSAVAVAADGTVWFVTADGRAPGRAAGMTIPQLAHLIRVLGGRDALNLDGGGSTTLWMDGEVVNHPSDNRRFDHEGERRVPDIICFRP